MTGVQTCALPISFFQLGLGFLIFVLGAKLATGDGRVSFFWYALGYLLLAGICLIAGKYEEQQPQRMA